MIEVKNFKNINNDESLEIFLARSSIEISRYLSGRPANFNAHKNFINYLKNQNNKEYFMVLKDNKFIGVIGFTNIIANTAEIIIYKNPKLVGVGEILIQILLEKANELMLKELYTRVTKDNIKAIKLFSKYNFSIDNEKNDDEIYINKKL